MPQTYHALVTGASGALGGAYARLLARQRGFSLLIVGRNRTALARRKEEIESIWREAGVEERTVTVMECDLASPDDRRRWLAEIDRRGYAIDCLIQCAGVLAFHPFLHRNEREYRELLEVNVEAPLELMRHFLPSMIERRRGWILNIGSRWSFQPGPYLAVYCASKAFLMSLTVALSAEMRGTGVTLSVQCPGAIEVDARPRVWNWVPRPTPERVAGRGLRLLEKNRPVQVDGFLNRVFVGVAAALPRVWTGSLLARIFRRQFA